MPLNTCKQHAKKWRWREENTREVVTVTNPVQKQQRSNTGCKQAHQEMFWGSLHWWIMCYTLGPICHFCNLKVNILEYLKSIQVYFTTVDTDMTFEEHPITVLFFLIHTDESRRWNVSTSIQHFFQHVLHTSYRGSSLCCHHLDSLAEHNDPNKNLLTTVYNLPL